MVNFKFNIRTLSSNKILSKRQTPKRDEDKVELCWLEREKAARRCLLIFLGPITSAELRGKASLKPKCTIYVLSCFLCLCSHGLLCLECLLSHGGARGSGFCALAKKSPIFPSEVSSSLSDILITFISLLEALESFIR